MNFGVKFDADMELEEYTDGTDFTITFELKASLKYLRNKEKCNTIIEQSRQSLNSSKAYCPAEFHNSICWPYAEAGKLLTSSCSSFYLDGDGCTMGQRYCQENGTWEKQNNYVVVHTAYSDYTNMVQHNKYDEEIASLEKLRIVYNVGYGFSLACLVVALFLLSFFKRLHCTRNYIHMNLMVSFVFRYVLILVKDRVIRAHYQINDSESSDEIEKLLQDNNNNEPNWELTRCRIVIILMHYAITSNYYWLLVEGLYLQMLLIFTMSENKCLKGFFTFGWGGPWLSVFVFVALRIHFGDGGCWYLHDERAIKRAIKIPIIISIMINFIIFINVVRLIISKLRAHNMTRKDVKMRLAKSTLALIPLLGVHYIVFLALTRNVDGSTSSRLSIGFEAFLSSMQGALVSILYCFLNQEVRIEITRAWKLWKTHKDLPSRGSPNIRKISTTIGSQHSSRGTQSYSRYSTTGGDAALHEADMQYPMSVRDCETKRACSLARNSSSITDAPMEKSENGDFPDPQTKSMNRDYVDKHETSSQIEKTPVGMAANEPKVNSNVECCEDKPFLEENSV